ncbi:MAG: chromosome segregation protein SMC [Planctomycetes bacterium]|nr:chromosome segregation protein SMC [Planctomycetota bacterium]
MLLRTLELHGFKSFAHKTEIAFEPGITGIVGPNGCGKSNVVDGLKWVLGEQSARSLRGKEMSDVIFNGSAGMSPLNFAKVSITFDNKDKRLPIDDERVTIERRLFRSGQSEYVINGRAARLKDVKDLFKDTGIGMRGYSVIEQGQVEVLLTSSTKERRKIFEEAAGIGRFKQKKEAALRKLEAVEHNLQRLGDVADEIGRQIRNVKTQATKAQNYREYTEKLKELRIAQSLLSYHELKIEKESLTETLTELKQHEGKLKTEINELQTSLEKIDKDLVFQDKQFESLHHQLLKLTDESSSREEKLAVARTQLVTETRNIEKLQALIEDLQERKKTLNSEKREIEEKLEEIENELESEKTREGALSTEMKKVDDRIAETEAELNGARDTVDDCLTNIRSLEHERIRIEAADESSVGETRSAGERLDIILEELEKLKESENEISSMLDEANELLASREMSQGTKNSRLLSERDTVNNLSREIDKIRMSFQEIESKKKTLAQFIDSFEGVEAGTKLIVESKAKGVIGIVSDLVSADEETGKILQRYIGRFSSHVLVEDEKAEEAARKLVAESGLEAQIVVASVAARTPKVPLPASWKKKDATPVAETISATDKKFDGVLSTFANAYIVEDMAAIARLLKDAPSGITLIAKSGEIVDTDGRFEIGEFSAEGGRFAQKAELERLERESAEVKSELQRLQGEKEKRLKVLELLESEVEELKAKVYEGRYQALSHKKELEGVGKRAEFLGRESARLKQSLSGAKSIRENNDKRRKEITDKIDSLCELVETSEATVEKKKSELKELAGGRSEFVQKLSDQRVVIVRLEQLGNAFRKDLDTTNNQIASMKQMLDRSVNEKAESDAILKSAKVTIRDNEEFIKEARQTRVSIEERLSTVTEKRAEIREAYDTKNESLRSSQSEYQMLLSNVGQMEVKEANAASKQRAVVERLWEEYEVDLGDVYIDRGIAGIDPIEVSRGVEDMQQKLKRLGNVNMDAIDELDGLQKRFDLLGTQKSDLDNARKQLLSIIRKIESTSRKMFLETFTLIQENFRSLFRKLFGGGHADLCLEDENDPLESGIEIIARPPGKEPRSITLLSGGEKALTAVSILLAIFKARPSPFAILDEVDAPLDEANIGRFRDVIKEFSQESQFLVITHAKPTMAAASVLYGITQEQKGISKKVMVRLDGKAIRSETGEEIKAEAGTINLDRKPDEIALDADEELEEAEA